MSPHKRTGLLAAAIVGGVAVLLLSVVGVVIAQKDATGKPRADKEGEAWTIKDLAVYLERNGLDMEVRNTWEDEPDGPKVHFRTSAGETIHIQRAASSARARELAGKHTKDRAFAWGPFSIFADGKSLDLIRQLLN